MSREKLSELGEVHAELKRLMIAIEAETGKSAPDMAELAAVRLKLTQASRRRGTLVNDFIVAFMPGASAEEKARLEALRQDLQQARFISAEHIGKWTTRSIAKDWAGYGAASNKIRAAMRAQIDREAALFRSLLAT